MNILNLHWRSRIREVISTQRYLMWLTMKTVAFIWPRKKSAVQCLLWPVHRSRPSPSYVKVGRLIYGICFTAHLVPRFRIPHWKTRIQGGCFDISALSLGRRNMGSRCRIPREKEEVRAVLIRLHLTCAEWVALYCSSTKPCVHINREIRRNVNLSAFGLRIERFLVAEEETHRYLFKEKKTRSRCIRWPTASPPPSSDKSRCKNSEKKIKTPIRDRDFIRHYAEYVFTAIIFILELLSNGCLYLRSKNCFFSSLLSRAHGFVNAFSGRGKKLTWSSVRIISVRRWALTCTYPQWNHNWLIKTFSYYLFGSSAV